MIFSPEETWQGRTEVRPCRVLLELNIPGSGQCGKAATDLVGAASRDGGYVSRLRQRHYRARRGDSVGVPRGFNLAEKIFIPGVLKGKQRLGD